MFYPTIVQNTTIKGYALSHIKQLNKQIMFSLHRNAGKYKITQNIILGNPEFKTAPPNKVMPR